METITVKEALAQGYELCGYAGEDFQHLKNIAELDSDDFEAYHGNELCVANKQSYSASISSEEVIEWLTDRYFDQDDNPDDDYHDMALRIKEEKEFIEKFVEKINGIYSQKKWWYINDKLQLIP